jgi:hypothetical protein
MRALITISVIVITTVAGFLLGASRPQNPPGQQAIALTVPLRFGTFKGGTPDALVFEDATGTVRFVDCTRSQTCTLKWEISRR